MILHVTKNEYKPDVVSAPGETLLDILEEKGISQTELARRMGRPIKTINEIINGKAAITPDTSLQLELALGVPASFWNNFERSYREYLARQEEEKRLSQHTGWLKELPLKSMISLGWIRKRDSTIQQLREVLNYFGVVSPMNWDVLCGMTASAFRQSKAFESEAAAVAAWLRKGYLDALEIECQPFNEAKFRKTLPQIRALTLLPPEQFMPSLTAVCADCGVAVVVVKELPKTRLCGASRWISPTKALIQLSLRYRTNDHFWFTFFHEAGHLLLHGKKEFFIDTTESPVDEKEAEANAFAADILAPPSDYNAFCMQSLFTEASIVPFASRLGIAPGIIVGRLQHEKKIPFTHFNHLKKKFQWKGDH